MAMAKLNGNANKPATNIWQVMNYQVPRGKCVHKASVLSSSCPCLRFMLNPLQAASSFACDGCGHHASFHNLRNPGEDFEGGEVVREDHALLLAPRKLLNGTATRKRSATTSASAGGGGGGGGGRVENGRALGGGGGGGDGDSEDDVQIVKRVRN